MTVPTSFLSRRVASVLRRAARMTSALALAVGLMAGAAPAAETTAKPKAATTAKKPAAKAPAKKAAAKKPVSKKPAAKKPAVVAPDSTPVPNVIVTTERPPVSPLTPREKEMLAQAMKAAAKHEWGKARDAVAPSRNTLLHKIVEWAFLRAPGPHASFEERTRFLTANPRWPNAGEMRRRAEETIDDSVSLATVSTWFAANPPLTSVGKMAYARALRAQGQAEQAHTMARDAWVSGAFGKDDERDFIREFGAILTPDDHWARIDRILYDGQTTAADRLLPYVSPDRARVANARIALITSAKNTEGAIAAVPENLKNDSGLLYDRVKWRRERDDNVGARQLIPAYALDGPRPDLWWRARHALARNALGEGNITEAYTLAKHHGSIDALSVSEAEWLAGWIALRFLKDGEAALVHFEKVYDSVQTPPSLARGAYWTGRATEYLGRPDLAAEWYQKAATYVTTYYGQLALGRMKGDSIPQLPQDPAPTPEERSAFNRKELTQALRALMEIDAKPYQRAFAQAVAAESDLAVERHMTAELVSQLRRTDLGVVVARQAAREKITLLRYGYPTPLVAYPNAPEKALILSIIRQESNFDAGALSSAGARGLMQLMPATARGLAKKIKVPYAERKLTTDIAYNMRLGSTFLSDLVASFDGSYILAAAAYNAGPSRARQWIRQFGDPRDPNVDAVDWIEQIPFSETRSYVQHVMENVMVYRAILGGTPNVGKTLEAELARRQ
jgi:soluble lytic murein transglycosylase